MTPAENFKVSLKKALTREKITPEIFGQRVGMSRQKIRALSDPSGDRKVDINDACIIAEELNTTVGYMTGNVLTSRGLKAIGEMANYIDDIEKSREPYRATMAKYEGKNIVGNIRALLKQIDRDK